MGFLSSGGKGNSRANTHSESATNNTTNTIVDNRVTTSDFGAIEGAVDISREVIEFGTRAFDRGADVTDRALETAERATDIGVNAAVESTGQALDFGRDALKRLSDANADSLGRVTSIANDALYDVRGVSEHAIDAVSDAGEGILDFASSIFGNALDSNRKTVEQNIAGLTALARETSQTADDRIVKVVMYSVGAAAAAILGFSLLRSS